MPIVVRAKKGDDTNVLIKKFKKFLQIDDIVTEVRERRYHKNAATKRKEAKKSLAHRLMLELLRARRAAQRA